MELLLGLWSAPLHRRTGTTLDEGRLGIRLTHRTHRDRYSSPAIGCNNLIQESCHFAGRPRKAKKDMRHVNLARVAWCEFASLLVLGHARTASTSDQPVRTKPPGVPWLLNLLFLALAHYIQGLVSKMGVEGDGVGKCADKSLGSTEVSAFGGYRANDPVHSYCFRGPRWNYAAAYYQSYRHRRVYRRTCGCR